MINTRAAGDSRFARTGKDGAIYNADGVLLATVDSFTANVTYNNAAYSVLGNALWNHRQCLYGISRACSREETAPRKEWCIVSAFRVDRLIYRTLPSGMLSREHGTLRSTDHRNYRTYLHWVKKYSAIHRRVPRWHPPFNFNNIF